MRHAGSKILPEVSSGAAPGDHIVILRPIPLRLPAEKRVGWKVEVARMYVRNVSLLTQLSFNSYLK
jgi:hypothetical protein